MNQEESWMDIDMNRLKCRGKIRGRRDKNRINVTIKNKSKDVKNLETRNRKEKVMVIKVGRKLIFWNISGATNKDKEFWKYIKDFDFVSLSETWLDENGWNKINNRLSKTHIYGIVILLSKQKRKKKQRVDL